jgi:hypothetical protein
MRFGKLILFGLTNILIGTLARVEAYDIEMFTFYPYHCESNLMQQMKKVFACDVFIETGTLEGETAFSAAAIFDQVYSVELAENFFKAAQNRNTYSNVFLYHDSSDCFLESLLPHIQDKRKLFWLDAHFSGGNTATLIDEGTDLPKSPIWGELIAIFKNNLQSSVILIDDISGYLLNPVVDMSLAFPKFFSWRGCPLWTSTRYRQKNAIFERLSGKGLHIERPRLEKNLGNSSIRYPHLNHQYDLIKKNCTTAQLYVVGDLAIVYDSVYHSPSISPIVQACTVSRMFDWDISKFEDEKAVLRAEYELVQRCHENEADRICYLSGYCNCRDYRLWRGLIYLGRGDFIQAAKDFQFVIDAGLTHWRVNFYLGYALTKSEMNAQAGNIFQNINVHLEEHELFLNQAYPH